MKITAEPTRVDDLLRFLRGEGYGAREAGFGIVEIDDLAVEGRRIIKLATDLGVWRAINRTTAEIVSSGGSAGLLGSEPPEGDARR